jgi:hypothetical protein
MEPFPSKEPLPAGFGMKRQLDRLLTLLLLVLVVQSDKLIYPCNNPWYEEICYLKLGRYVHYWRSRRQ